VKLLALALFGLAYTAFTLFGLAALLRRSMAPRRAAWLAFGVAGAVNAATALYAAPGEPLSTLLLFALCHLLLLPVLLLVVRRQEGV
jgi:hypothetical protein